MQIGGSSLRQGYGLASASRQATYFFGRRHKKVGKKWLSPSGGHFVGELP